MSNHKNLEKLAPIPNAEALVEIRKSVRKKKSPSINEGDHGGHEKLGFFTVYLKDNLYIEWQSKGKTKKKNQLQRSMRTCRL